MRTSLVLVLATLLPGCALAVVGAQAISGAVKTARSRNTIGPTHAAHYQEGGPCTGTYADAPSLNVAIAMCNGWDAHLGDDDTRAVDPAADPLTAAAYVAMCAASDQCDPGQEAFYPGALTWAWDMSMRVDPTTVEAQLATSSLPGYTRTAFLARYTAARDHIHAQVDSLGAHWRDVFVKPMLEARATRAAADEVLAPWLAQADAFREEADHAVVAGKPDADVVETALAMRRNYAKACTKVRGDLAHCLGDAVGTKLTAIIHRLADARGDQALDSAEANIRWLDDYIDPRTAEWEALAASYAAERARFAEYAKAKADGISASAVAARWPDPPFDAPESVSFLGVPPAPGSSGNYASSDVDTVDEEVRSVKRHGKTATINFKKVVYVGEYRDNCHETNKVDGIDEYGHLIYREVCTGPWKKSVDDYTKKPVTVPWIEVQHVKPKEIIHVVFDKKTRVGHVSYVEKAQPKEGHTDVTRVQLREWRL
jgi:hypothetical protein